MPGILHSHAVFTRLPSIAACALVASALAAPASAHDSARVRLVVDAADADVELQLELGVEDVAELLGLPEGMPEETVTRTYVEELPTAVADWLRVRADGAPCPVRLVARKGTDPVTLDIAAACPAAPARLRLEWPAASLSALRLTAVGEVRGSADVAHPLLLDRQTPSVDLVLRVRDTRAVAWAFLASGVEHILIGWDHLAFLAALILACGSIRRLIAIVTAFTAAHSLTLALGATGLVTLSPDVVEPIIALSIGVAAALALRGHRVAPSGPGTGRDAESLGVALALAGGFGLVHGLGFAGLLTDALSETTSRWIPLLAFNLGVEVGQLAIVAVVFPALGALGRRSAGPRAFSVTLWGLVLLGAGVAVARWVG
jgi:hypothetical protein